MKTLDCNQDAKVGFAASGGKCPRYYTKADDGLKQSWRGKCWMNPPYGRVIGDWMRKAYESAQAGAMVVCLVPARTDTAWWHDYAAKDQVTFIRGRLKFGDGKNSAPFPSALVILKAHNDKVSYHADSAGGAHGKDTNDK